MGSYNFYVYIMASDSGTLYIGFTNDLERRVIEHKTELFPSFTKRYHCHRLVYLEHHTDATAAIAREKQLKGWVRQKKERLINSLNPGWHEIEPRVVLTRARGPSTTHPRRGSGAPLRMTVKEGTTIRASDDRIREWPIRE